MKCVQLVDKKGNYVGVIKQKGNRLVIKTPLPIKINKDNQLEKILTNIQETYFQEPSEVPKIFKLYDYYVNLEDTFPLPRMDDVD